MLYGLIEAKGMDMKIRCIYMFWVILLFGCICVKNTRVYAMDIKEFATEEMSITDSELFLDNVNLNLLNIEPSKRPIRCFDVNEHGMLAIGTEEGSNKTIAIYSDTGIFQYGYRFYTDGSFDVELSNEELKIYFVRSDVAVSMNFSGEIQYVSRICDTSENNTYWNQYVRARSRSVGEYQYVLKNDIGILGIFTSTYSQIYRIDRSGNEQLIYNVNLSQFISVLTMFLGILFFICIVAVIIIKEFKIAR